MKHLWLKRCLLLLALGLGLAFAQDRLILATTTSTENSGLLDFILPDFENHFNLSVDVVAVGTGAALELGANGNADVLLVHAPEDEEKLVESLAAVNRRYLMYNDFVVVGPTSDPAGIASSANMMEALHKIADSQGLFISRGDDSGTHKKELSLWAEAGITPDWEGYQEVGQGMGNTLTIANEQLAYTLTDRGTYLAMKDNLELPILFAGDEALFNPYHVMAVNPDLYPHVNYIGAMTFIAYLTSPETQAKIAEFTVAGESLFFPSANKKAFD